IDWRVERNPRLAPAGDVLSVALGVGSRKLAPRIASARDQSGPDGIRFDRKPKRFDPGFCRFQVFRCHARDQQVLPNREPDIAVAHLARDVSESANLCNRQIPDRNDNADPMQPFLLLGVNTNVRCPGERWTHRHRARYSAVKLAPELLLDQTEKLVDAHRIKNIFQPRLGAVGAVAVIDENANHCVGNLAGVGRFNDDAGIARKILVAGQTAEAEPEPDPRIETKSLFHRRRLKADVVGVLQNWNSAGTVEGNIEFARQTVQRPIVEDVEVPFARIRPSVDKFLRIDAGGGRTGYIANIIR